MSPPPPPASRWGDFDDREASPRSWKLARSIALASLAPFLPLFLGHYFSITLFLPKFTGHGFYASYIRSYHSWVHPKRSGSVILGTETAIAAVSFIVISASAAWFVSAHLPIYSRVRLSPWRLLSKMKALWWEPSVLRVYSTIVLLGYVLSLVLVFSIVFLISGDELQSREREFLLYLLAALSLIYTGALASVGAFGFLREDGRHGVEALWRAAALMDDMKLVSFLVFFLLQATAHRVLVIGGAWEDEICSIRLPAEISISPKPVLASAVWTLGACGFFGQVGILLQA